MVLRHLTVDTLTELKDAGAVTSSAAAQVGGSDKVLDLGAATMLGTIVLEVSAIDVADNNELYVLTLQLSSTSDFSSDIVEGPSLRLGALESLGNDADSVVGRYLLPFTNLLADTEYRYARMFHTISGTTPSINYTARMSKDI